MLRGLCPPGRPAARSQFAQKHVALCQASSPHVGMWGRELDRQNQQRRNSSGIGSGSGGNDPDCACGEGSEVEVEIMVTAVGSETVGSDSDNAFIPFGIPSN